MRYALAAGLVLALAVLLCVSPRRTQAQADPTILARQAELAATAQIVRATDAAAARERARIAAEAAAAAERERANAQATAIVLNAQNTAQAVRATGTAIPQQTGTALAIVQATGTAQAAGTQIAGAATQAAATQTAAPIQAATAQAAKAEAQAQSWADFVRTVRMIAWVIGIALLMGAGIVALVLMLRFAMSIRMAHVKPTVIEVARSDESPKMQPMPDDDTTADAEGANVTGDPRFASVVIDNILDQMREAAQ